MVSSCKRPTQFRYFSDPACAEEQEICWYCFCIRCCLRIILHCCSRSKGFLGMFPALFTSFSCCGGGLLALIIGPTTFPSLALQQSHQAPLSPAACCRNLSYVSRDKWDREVLAGNSSNIYCYSQWDRSCTDRAVTMGFTRTAGDRT